MFDTVIVPKQKRDFYPKNSLKYTYMRFIEIIVVIFFGVKRNFLKCVCQTRGHRVRVLITRFWHTKRIYKGVFAKTGGHKVPG